MSTLLSQALYLQDAARQILREKEAGAPNKEEHEDKTVAWVLARRRFAGMEPATPLDALSLLHSLGQAASALLPCREDPDAVDGLAAELQAGLRGLIAYHERAVGRARDELGLFDDYLPPTGVN